MALWSRWLVLMMYVVFGVAWCSEQEPYKKTRACNSMAPCRNSENCKHEVPYNQAEAEQVVEKERWTGDEKNGGGWTDSGWSEGGNILFLHPIYSGSHERVLRRLGEALVRRGHRATQVRWRSSLSREVNSTMNVMTLSPDNSELRFPYMDRNGTFQPPTTMLWERPRRQWQVPLDIFRIIDAHCQTLLGDALLLSDLRVANFSVAVVDLIGNECSLALAHRLGIPVVGFWGFSFQGSEPRAMGVFQSPAIVPAFLSEVGGSMTFLERVWNTGVTLMESVICAYHFHVADSNIRRLMPQVPDSRQLLSGVEAVFVNTHWLLDYPKLLPPHVQYIGCIMCGPPAPLPPHLHSWVSEASAGVVVFSLGYTGFDASSVPSHVMKAFLAAFSRLQQRVLLRFNSALLHHVPHNILVLDWFPQHDILAHPNTVLFVTHCGLGSVSEAVYHGVPLVAVPVFADQGDNARRVADRGLGVVVDKSEITEHTVFTAITTVLNDHRYRQTAGKFSRLWQEEKPGVEVAVRWVERVMRHGSLPHLRMPGANLSLPQYFAIDAYIFLLVLFLAPPSFLWYFCRRKSSAAATQNKTTSKQKIH